MTFLTPKDIIEDGDILIAYTNPTTMKALKIKKDEFFINRFGRFEHNAIIGQPFGSKIESTNKKGYFYALYPTPELWTQCLPHRTQILYQPDISLVTQFLRIQPGINMIEAGTGSGSFTHSISRTIYPSGQLFTFEYHAERVSIAKAEFKSHGLDNVILQHRDVCKDGFGLENAVSAIFLDLPSPWEALAAAKLAFQKDRIGRICCFSPCIEQVQRTCEVLKDLGFTDIRMFEVLMREHELRKVEQLEIPDANEFVKSTNKRLFGDELSGVLTSKITKNVRGHTSFLTFAVYYPE